MLFNPKNNIQIAGMTATRASFAFALQTDAHTIFDTGRNFNSQCTLLTNAAVAVTFLTRRLNDPPHPLTGWTGTFDGKESLLCAHATMPFAHAAIDGG